MPFGLTNAPATFQRAIDIILSNYKWRNCLVYLDDIIIFSKNVDDHFQDVEQVLVQLQHAGISLKLKKCAWFANKVKYLGHMIKPGQLEMDEVATAAIRKMLPPTTQAQLRSFLGACNVYRRFVPRYPHIAAPLNALLKKGQPVRLKEFGEAETDVFQTLKEMLTSAPVLALPKPDLPYSVDTDASDYQVGCALFQTYPKGNADPLDIGQERCNQQNETTQFQKRNALQFCGPLPRYDRISKEKHLPYIRIIRASDG